MPQNEKDPFALIPPAGNEEKRQALEMIEEARSKVSDKKPSFAGRLFFGTYASELLMPFPYQSAEDKAAGDQLIDPIMEYLSQNLDPEAVEETRTIPKNVLQELARRKIFALRVPKEYGGHGFSDVNYSRFLMKMASYCEDLELLISVHNTVGLPLPLRLFGTEEQKQKYFPRCCEGMITAFALTEPTVGSDPAKLKTTAKLSEDGAYYILNGEKLWCTNGPIAEVIVVIAATEPTIVNGKEKKQISAFIVETNSPGFEIAQRCEFMGFNGIHNGLLRFNNLKVPVENMLGKEGKGLGLALTAINIGRLSFPASSVANSKRCLAIARKWGSSRIQWGSPIGMHEEGRKKIGFIAATTYAMEAVCYLTSGWGDEKRMDLRVEAAMAKLFCSEYAWKIADEAMQLVGGRGYEKAKSLKARGEMACSVEQIMRNVRVTRIVEGTSEIMRLFIAREAMDPHLKMASEYLEAKSFSSKIQIFLKLSVYYTRWYSKQWLGCFFCKTIEGTAALSSRFKYIEKTTHRLAKNLFKAIVTYRQRLESKQMLLARFVEIGTELFAMSAACSFALSKQNETREQAVELANLFCSMAEQRIEEHFRAIKSNPDSEMNALAKKVLDNDYLWLEEGIFTHMNN